MTTPEPEELSVDIVVNNYNYDSYLPEAVESALSQTHPAVNVVVVDDGSTDDSRAILRSYADRADVVLKKNGGQASALNAGMERCSGDVVIFLDADDLLKPEAAARAAAALASNPEAVKVQQRMDVIDSDGCPSGAIKPPPHLPMPNGDLQKAELTYPFDLVWQATSANAFRTDAVQRILPIPEDEYPVCGADWYLVHLTTLLGSVISLDEVGASYRVHGRNSYELGEPKLDLPHVRQAIGFARSTSAELLRLADELELPHPARILSLADLANRLTSLKLEPRLHPIPGDRRGRLLIDAVRAAARRSDVSMSMKLLFVAWFGATAASPRPLAGRLAELFLFPERRSSFNRLLVRLHRANKVRNGALAGLT